MKKLITISVAVLMLGASNTFSADAKAEEIFEPGLIMFDGAQVFSVLDIYREITGRETLMAANVHNLAATITLRPGVPLKISELVKLLETTLLEQAGVVITKLDEKRVSVTYNDALPLKLAPGAKPPGTGRFQAFLIAPEGRMYTLAKDGRLLVPLMSSASSPTVLKAPDGKTYTLGADGKELKPYAENDVLPPLLPPLGFKAPDGALYVITDDGRTLARLGAVPAPARAPR